MNVKYSWIRNFIFVLMLISMLGFSSKYTGAQEPDPSFEPEAILNGHLHLVSPPIKILDTRDSIGFLSAGDSLPIYVWGSLRNQVIPGVYLTPPRPWSPPLYYLDPTGVCIGITVINPSGQGNIKIGPTSDPVGIQTTFAQIGMNISNYGCTSQLSGNVSDIGGVNQIPDLRATLQFAGAHLVLFLFGYYY